VPNTEVPLQLALLCTCRCRGCLRKRHPAELASLGALHTAAPISPFALRQVLVADSAESSARHFCVSPALDKAVSGGLLIKMCHWSNSRVTRRDDALAALIHPGQGHKSGIVERPPARISSPPSRVVAVGRRPGLARGDFAEARLRPRPGEGTATGRISFSSGVLSEESASTLRGAGDRCVNFRFGSGLSSPDRLKQAVPDIYVLRPVTVTSTIEEQDTGGEVTDRDATRPEADPAPSVHGPRHARKQPLHRRPLLWVFGLFLALFGVSVPIVAGVSATVDHPYIAPPKHTVTVVYSVTGSGTTDTTSITYRTLGDEVEETGAPLPWRRKVVTASPVRGAVFSVIAVNRSIGLSYVVCSISVNGNVLSYQKAEGPYAVAPCIVAGSSRKGG
jgi:hypothetical protein